MPRSVEIQTASEAASPMFVRIAIMCADIPEARNVVSMTITA